jgi:hypothetical protein
VVAVLRKCGYPTDVLVIDFETYFDDEYKMARGSGDGLTTVEYVPTPASRLGLCVHDERHATRSPTTKRHVLQVGEEMVATQLSATRSGGTATTSNAARSSSRTPLRRSDPAQAVRHRAPPS